MTAALGSRENPIPRLGVRVLMLDAAGRVLLVRSTDPGRPGSRYWFTVGGGLEPGEDLAMAAVRELAEETGLHVQPGDLGPPVFAEVTEFPFDGRWYRQEQVFLVLRVLVWEVPVDLKDPAILEHRWWSVDELAETTETVYPRDLAHRLRGMLGQ